MPEHLGPALIDSEGRRHDLNQRQYEVIVSMATRLGLDIVPDSGASGDTLISTGQAAEILGVSRRTVTRMLDRGEIPGIRLGLNHHRSVRLADVLEFQQRNELAQPGNA